MTRITRIEVIDENGRSYVNHEDDNDVTLSYQDDGRTLKVFVNKVKTKSPAEEAFKRVSGGYPDTSTDDYGEYYCPTWKYFSRGYNAAQDEKVCEYRPTPQTENEVAEGLKEAFREAVKQGVIPKTKELNKEVDSMKENPPEFLKFELGPTLFNVIEDWWDDVFTNKETSLHELVDAIEEWLPKEQSAKGSQNAYVECTVEGFNDAITQIKNRLK